MDIIYLDRLQSRKFELIGKIRNGAIFIYPTDTIYGMGCDATNYSAVEKLRKIKNRPNAPFSIIVPDIEWIYENCYVDDEVEEWLSKLPGRYTLILKMKNPFAVATNVSFNDTIGIRIPDHEIIKFLAETKKPIITTSVNKSSEDFMTSLDDLDEDIAKAVDFIIYDGVLEGTPSTIVDLVHKKIIKRK